MNVLGISIQVNKEVPTVRMVVLSGTRDSPTLVRTLSHTGRKDADLAQRLVELMHDLESLIRDNKPTCVVVRSPDKSPKPPKASASRIRGEFDGVALAVAREQVSKVVEMPGVALATSCGTNKEGILAEGASLAGDTKFADATAAALAALILAVA